MTIGFIELIDNQLNLKAFKGFKYCYVTVERIKPNVPKKYSKFSLLSLNRYQILKASEAENSGLGTHM